MEANEPMPMSGYELFFDAHRASLIGIAIENLEGQPLFVNPALCSMLGFSEEELCSKHCVDFSPSEDAEKDWALFQQLRTGSIDHYSLEKRYFRRDGSLMWGRLSISLLKNGGSPLVVAVVEDITEKRTAQETLELAAEHMTAVIRCSRNLRYLWANQGCAHLLERPLGEIVGRPIVEVLGTEAFETLRPYFERVLAGEKVTYERELTYKGVKPRWTSATYSPTRDAGGIVDGWVATLTDITDRKRAEKALLQSTEELRQAQRLAQLGSWHWDLATDRVTWSEELYRMTGCDPRLPPPAYREQEQLFAAESWQRLQPVVERTLRTGEPYEIELEVRRPDGTTRWVIGRGETEKDAAGHIVCLRGTAQDITERRKAGEARPRLASIVESSEDAISSADLSGVITSWNRGAQRMFGYTKEEAIGKPITLVVPPELHDEAKGILRRLRAGERIEQYETRRVAKDGRTIQVSFTLSPLKDAEGKIIGASNISRDITESKRAQAALRESEERFRLVANSAPVMIWMTDVDKRCTYVNRPCVEFFGQSIETILGNGWSERIHPEDAKRSWDRYSRAFDQRKPFHLEHRLRRHDGEYRWILDTGVPRFNADGSFAGYIGSAIDMTERKLAEQALSTVSQRLIEAQEEERSWIARELHDDINQRLALLAVTLDGLTNDPTSPSGLRRTIAEATKELGDVSTDIQALSHRLHSSRLEHLGLAKAAASFCRELSDRHQVPIDLQVENVPSDLSKEASLCLFRVLQEALQNAIKYSRSSRYEVTLSGKPVAIELTVQDWGKGFLLDDAMQAGGIGLISMKERLKLVNGEVSIDSQPGRGTTVHARVPLLGSAKPAAADA